MRTHKDRVTGCRRPLDCLGTRRRHPYRRMRLLERLRQYFNVVEREVFSAVTKTLVAPRCQDDFNRFAKTEMALVLRHGEGPELARIESAPGAPVHPAAGKDIEQRDLLGQPDRMVKRSERHPGSYAQPFGARGRVRAHHGYRRTDTVVIEMMLGEPDRVVPAAIHYFDPLQCALEHGRQCHPSIWPTEELQDSEFHRRESSQ